MRAIVLNRYRQGESSLILKIFTDELGLISSYMPGGLKKKEIPEIGDLLECTPRRRSSEGLYSLYEASVMNKYQFPVQIERQAMRDILFEILWKTLPEEDSQEEMFVVLEKYLSYLDVPSRTLEELFFALWLSLLRYSETCGFGLVFEGCTRCGATDKQVAILFDGLVCQQCHSSGVFLPETLAKVLQGRELPSVIGRYSSGERMAITGQLISYIQEHTGFQGGVQAVAFLRQIMSSHID